MMHHLPVVWPAYIQKRTNLTLRFICANTRVANCVTLDPSNAKLFFAFN